MLNKILLFLILVSLATAFVMDIARPAPPEGQQLALDATVGVIWPAAKGAVELAIGLVGAMALFLGLFRILEDGGMLRVIARFVAPVMRPLFPGVPAGHPAMTAMLLNIGSNMMGLGNAATPFGIRAVQELDKLNEEKGTATNAMVMFLALNTSALALLPTGVMSIRASKDSANPAAIMITTWVASGCATVIAIMAAWMLSKRYPEAPAPSESDAAPSSDATDPEPAASASSAATGSEDEALDLESEIRKLEGEDNPRVGPAPRHGAGIAKGVVLAFAGLAVAFLVRRWQTADSLTEFFSSLSNVVMAAIFVVILSFGWARGVRVYESVVDGAKQGFQVALRIIPYLVTILVGIAMFRACGALDAIIRTVDFLTPAWVTAWFPLEAIPLAIVRPLSGTGGMAVMAELLETHGPDSYIGLVASTMNGSTDTTFYILAVYFGAVGVRKTRHAVPACLAADAAGVLGAVTICYLLFG